jgi:ribose/xylose/arabinose/galactoside ABC-type transport system permease subunit
LPSRRALAVLRPWLVLALVAGGFSLHPRFAQTFWTRSFLPNVAQQAASNVILAVGMTFVILTGGIDLSVGSVLALCGVTLGLSAEGGAPLAVALVVALGAGVGCGLVNGLLVTAGRVPPFVVTLGMMTAARGLTVFATDGNSVSGLPPGLFVLGQGWPLVALALAVVVAGAILQHHTRAGRYLTAIGGNEEAARLSGVPVARCKALAYALAGLTAALAGVVTCAKFQSADTGAGANAELNAIAAVVIGGTRLSGGHGSVVGSLVGALTIVVLNAGLVLVGVRDTLQGVVVGAVIVVTVMIDQRRAR